MKRFMLTTAILILSLATISMAEISITTADGNGADTSISNDGNKPYTSIGGGFTSLESRHYDGVRAKATIYRFDISGGVGGDLSGATLTFGQFTATRSRTVAIYALADGEWDNWDEMSTNYGNFPGMSEPYNDGYLHFDPDMYRIVGSAATVQDSDWNTVETLVSAELDASFVSEDTNGLVTLMVYQEGSDGSASFYFSSKESIDSYPEQIVPLLSFPNALPCATSPVPVNGSVSSDIPTTLSWTNVTPAVEGGEITCDVYFGADPNFPSMEMVSTGAGVNSVALSSFATAASMSQGTYYWCVMTHDSSSDPVDLGISPIWNFTYSLAPIAVTQPEDVEVAPGDTAEFTFGVSSISGVTYSWYSSADDAVDTSDDDVAVGANSATLTLADVSGSDQGYYYCVTSNGSTEFNVTISETASLAVLRQVAGWNLDELVADQYADVSGEGNNLDPNNPGMVNFVEGAAGQAVAIDAAGFATGSGDFNPTYITDQLTIGLWIKWGGSTGSYQSIVGKRDTWANEDMAWQIGVNSSDELRFETATAGVSAATPAVGEWIFAVA
ncbi:MAG: immunoglobulin domain-containing protein, partial [Phycisphaerae bacterium]